MTTHSLQYSALLGLSHRDQGVISALSELFSQRLSYEISQMFVSSLVFLCVVLVPRILRWFCAVLLQKGKGLDTTQIVLKVV